MFPIVSFMCMAYDTVSVLKEAIKYLITKGDDFEDSKLLKYTMRTNKLTGCLGTVFFDKDDNSRAYSAFLVQQIKQNLTTSKWYFHDVAIIDKISENIMTIIDTIIWYEGSVPTNLRPQNPCPFDNYEIKESLKSKLVFYLLSTGFFIISVVFAYFSYKKFENTDKELKNKQIISASDMIFIFYFVFQFFQFIAEGPDQLSFKFRFKNYQSLFSLDLDQYFRLKFDYFWIMFYVVLTLALVFIFLSVAVFIQQIKKKIH